MKNVRAAFEVFEGDVHQLPSGFQEIKCHIIFDVKHGENFRRKARLVAGGKPQTPPPHLPTRQSFHEILFGLHLPLRR